MPAKRLAEGVGVLVRGEQSNPSPLGVPVLGVLCAKSPALVFQHGTRVYMLCMCMCMHTCVCCTDGSTTYTDTHLSTPIVDRQTGGRSYT